MAKALEDTVFTSLEKLRPTAEEIRFEPTARRVRVMFGGTTIADTRAAMLMLEKRRMAIYYFPIKDVRKDLLVPTSFKSHHPGKGEATFFSVKVGEKLAEKAGWRYLSPERSELKDYVAFYWDKMDAWFEEDDEVFVHPRDPYHRVDVVRSDRHVRVSLEGTVLAESTRALALFESNLPTRWYIPREDVVAHLEDSDKITRCPYKGT